MTDWVLGLGLGLIFYYVTLHLFSPRDPEVIPRHNHWMTIEEQMVMSTVKDFVPEQYDMYRHKLWAIHLKMGYAQDRLDAAKWAMQNIPRV